jgi:hypothetical protein
MWSFSIADWLTEWDEACWEKGEKVEESQLNHLKLFVGDGIVACLPFNGYLIRVSHINLPHRICC